MGIGREHNNTADFGDGRGRTLSTVKLRCDNQELLSAVAAMKDVPLVEDCGSNTRSISHHVRTCMYMLILWYVHVYDHSTTAPVDAY